MLDQALITYGSPTLARLKTGSLFAVSCTGETLKRELDRLNGMLVPRGVRLTALQVGPERTLMYLYREQALNEMLSQPDVQAMLKNYGYRGFHVKEALHTLRERLAASKDFPHEIGVFLGYPLGDVIGFVVNGGRNCLCAGCWKAYENECEARRTFARLNKCRAVYTRLFAEGCPLTRLTVRTWDQAPRTSTE